jgi:hypothetical protein
MQQQGSADKLDLQSILGHADPAAGLQLMPLAAVGAPPGLAAGAVEDGEYCIRLVSGDMTWSVSSQLVWSHQKYGFANRVALGSVVSQVLSTTAADLSNLTQQ